MTKSINFSIVIPLYNKRESITRTLRAALNQSYQEFEVVIVDDGSTDGSSCVIEEFSDSRIKLFKQTNAGVSAARNKGIREASHEYIAFLDADDLWDKEFLSEMQKFIKDFPDAGMWGCAFDEVAGDHFRMRDFKIEQGFRGYVNSYFDHAKRSILFWTSAIIAKKSAICTVGFFDERICILGEDLDLWFRLAYHNKVAFNNNVLAHYNVGAENRGMKRKYPFHKSILSYMDKYQSMENENPDFGSFINLFKLRKIPELFRDYGLSKEEIQNFLRTINPAGQLPKHQFFLKMPFLIQKSFMFLWGKIEKL